MECAGIDRCYSMSDEIAPTLSWYTNLPTLRRSSNDKSPFAKRRSHFLTNSSGGQSFLYDFCIDSDISFMEKFWRQKNLTKNLFFFVHKPILRSFDYKIFLCFNLYTYNYLICILYIFFINHLIMNNFSCSIPNNANQIFLFTVIL